jgi:hypothetical protein
VDLVSNDGQAHDVQLYMDVSGGERYKPPSKQLALRIYEPEWISGNATDMMMTYGTSEPSKVIYHHASLLQPDNFTEINASAEDATVYLGMLYVSVTLNSCQITLTFCIG